MYLCIYRTIVVNLMIYLIILTGQSACVYTKVIIVNSNNGNGSTECCVNGECACSSLFTALLNVDNNTFIIITSESVVLNSITTMGSGRLTNLTITGSNVTIMCNYSGSVYCESCDDVMIKGITWDKCGDPNGTNIAGVTFNGTSNISLVNCTFKHSQLPAVSLLEVSDNILIQSCNFLSNIPLEIDHSSVLNITRISSPELSNNSNITITINDGYFYNNTGSVVPPLQIYIDDSSVANCNISFNKTKFLSNQILFNLHVEVVKLINVQLTEILVTNNSQFSLGVSIYLWSATDNVILSMISSNFHRNNGTNVYSEISGNIVTVMINYSNFTNSKPIGFSARVSTLYIYAAANNVSNILLYMVQFNNNVVEVSTRHRILNDNALGTVSIVAHNGSFKLKMFMVNFTSNKYAANKGGALSVTLPYGKATIHSNLITGCKFVGNKAPGHGAALYIDTKNDNDDIQIADTIFDKNEGGHSVVYLEGFLHPSLQQQHTLHNYAQPVIINSSNFTNNTATAMYLSGCDVKFSGIVLFKNNTAENGGAIYASQETTMTIEDEATVTFINNTARRDGGAVYVDMMCGYKTHGAYVLVNTFQGNSSGNTIFINNSAMITDNSLYFNVPRSIMSRCNSATTNISDPQCILYIPCQFNFTPPVNGKNKNICDVDYTLLNGTGAPIITSPHELRLYFPFSDGYNISTSRDHNVYFVKNNILGNPVKLTGAVFDHFGKPTVPTQFNIQLKCSQNTNCSEYALISDNRNYILTRSIDNLTVLDVSFKGKRIDTSHINLTVTLTSLLYSLNDILTTLVVELVPCMDHPGYTYSEESQTCVCYHDKIKCNDDGNEIKRGHWFGNIANNVTTSLCPNHYCDFTNRKQTSEGYFKLPSTINAQCNDYRIGRACGECSSGYTLSYDSTDCISIDQCGVGWTVLVITLTCLYWIAVVAGVFSLMYFRYQISLGHLCGLIYYYSMVGILLNNNPYVSDGAFQFVSILSSFAQLTPQFLGKLCFVKGMSGIDQLFIHYSHPVGVSFLLILIVVATRCSARISLFVSRCIIRVICLLILLSYTSIVSTSLLLLLPLIFTDVKEWYTYSSPNIQYFHGRHVIYGIVAVLCEIIVGIGLPLLLLFEPVLSKKINSIKIKPLLDQFQGCYKDKYRWFAAYYLICRQVIFLVTYTINKNYSNLLFYLQTACIFIAIFHIWIQPYQNRFLNKLDGIMLLFIVLEVNINTFTFLKDATTVISLMIVLLPLIFCSMIVMKKIFCFCLMKWHHRHYIPIADSVDDEREPDVVIRYVHTNIYSIINKLYDMYYRKAHFIKKMDEFYN